MNPQHLAVALQAAKAGAVELMSRREQMNVREKAPKDLVTDADLASQQAIRQILMQSYPDYAFVGEEEGETQPPDSVVRGDRDAPPCWVVDPLDGTVNYVHQLHSFAVSIGLYAEGRMVLGVIYDPLTDELFSALEGHGATCNGQPIRCSDCVDIEQALVASSFPPRVHRDDPEVSCFVRVLEQCQALRRMGSCALNMCYVAAGRLDAYWATSVKPWDVAAGTAIVRESGAVMTSVGGSALDDWNPKFCISSTAKLHRQMLELLNQ